MFHLFMSLFVGALFFVLTPGVFLRLPRKGSKTRVALTHALVFALIYYLTTKVLLNYFYAREGFAPMKKVDQEVQDNKFGAVGNAPARSPSPAPVQLNKKGPRFAPPPPPSPSPSPAPPKKGDKA